MTSFASLMARPCVTPDISAYRREGAHLTSVDAVATWMVYERSEAWWLAPGAQVRHAAVYWLGLREIVTGEVGR